MELTATRLRELLFYDEHSGVFVWLQDRQRARKGSVAGTICPMYGYRLIGIDYRHYRASRLAWLYMTGSWPEHLIDHKDRNRVNDAWFNLRQATSKQNNENKGARSNGSGKVGVSWVPSRRKWIAHITHGGKSMNLGRFESLDDAVAARTAAEARYFTHANS